VILLGTQIVCDAVTNEKLFICEALPCDLIGMNSAMMAQYIEFCADRLLLCLGCDKFYKATNPFPWMEVNCDTCGPVGACCVMQCSACSPLSSVSLP
jgi:ribonucleotide reductase beta subunit family protein with ferritin-like domain